MISPLTPKQPDINRKLLEEFGIKCLGKLTSDGTHMLYEDAKGKALSLPAPIEDVYSHFTYAQILAFLTKKYPDSVKSARHTYSATKQPNLQMVKDDDKKDK